MRNTVAEDVTWRLVILLIGMPPGLPEGIFCSTSSKLR